jgi:CoA:oxalate CoA-transferase
MAALVLQNNLMIRVEMSDGPAHARFAQWLESARRDGVPFAEQAERMPRSRPVGMTAVYYRTYATKDAALAIACGSPALRRRFITAIGLGDPALEGAITDDAALDEHYARLRFAAEAVVAGRTTAEWQRILEAAGVPASGVMLPIEALDAEQPAANGMFHRYDHAQLGPVTVLGAPLAMGDGGFAAGPPTPPFGTEVRDILSEAGFTGAELERLLAGGAVSPRVP